MVMHTHFLIEEEDGPLNWFGGLEYSKSLGAEAPYKFLLVFRSIYWLKIGPKISLRAVLLSINRNPHVQYLETVIAIGLL